MKFNTKKAIVNFLIALCLLFFIGGNALAESNSDSLKEDYSQHSDNAKADSFLQQQVDKMDPAVQPYAQLVADNIVAAFIFVIGAFILLDTILASYSKKKGRTNESAGYKHSQWETFAQGIVGIILFGIFAALVQSGKIGLI